MNETCTLVGCPCGHGPKPEDPVNLPPDRITTIAETVYWLRTELPEIWDAVPWGELEWVAVWLLMLRSDVRNGRWRL